ncbi:MAG: hypothetical protein J6Y19_00470, partial [Kiritimatiellae bacterium]|nr:hypothetical protein [Kiritimatiellia bacterium]
SAQVTFMHSPNLQDPVRRSYMTLYYSFDGTSWTKGSTLEDAGQVYPSLVYKSLTIPVPEAALKEGVYLKLSADSAYRQVTDTVTNQFGARIEGLKVIAAPKVDDVDWSCGSKVTRPFTPSSTGWSASGMSTEFSGLTCATGYAYRVWATDEGGNASLIADGRFTTLAGQEPPLEVWAENIRQNHMTVAWAASGKLYSEVEPEGSENPHNEGWYEDTPSGYVETADASVQEGKTYYAATGTDATGYQIQVASELSGTWSRDAVSASSTTADLGEGDDWAYVGGGTEVPALPSGANAQDTKVTGRGTYPAYAGGSETSQVLAGEGNPGIESVEFSTVGATGGTVTFTHGRWYNSGDLSSGPVTVSYSTDGGASWTDIETTDYSDLTEFATVARSIPLPAGALGHASVKVRLEARAATVVSSVPVGCAVRNAKVTLTGAHGDYTGHPVTTSGLDSTGMATVGADQLTYALEGLTANHTYYFRVRATDGVGDPDQYGEWVEGAAKTLAAPGTPGQPWAVDVGRHAMTIRWQPVEGAETYTVVVYQGGSEVTRFTGVANTEQMVTGLSGSTTYTFKVSAQADGETSALSAEGTATTTAQLRVTGLRAEDILDTSMTLKWDRVSGVTYTLHWGEAAADGATTLKQRVACPASSLKRSDAGNKWFYFGGNGTWPAYWTSSSSPATDHGHALIYGSGYTAPGIQSRWFSTFDASAAYVEFMHGR